MGPFCSKYVAKLDIFCTNSRSNIYDLMIWAMILRIENILLRSLRTCKPTCVIVLSGNFMLRMNALFILFDFESISMNTTLADVADVSVTCSSNICRLCYVPAVVGL